MSVDKKLPALLLRYPGLMLTTERELNRTVWLKAFSVIAAVSIGLPVFAQDQPTQPSTQPAAAPQKLSPEPSTVSPNTPTKSSRGAQPTIPQNSSPQSSTPAGATEPSQPPAAQGQAQDQPGASYPSQSELGPMFPTIPPDNPGGQPPSQPSTGQAATGSGLQSGPISQDYSVINRQNTEFTRRYLLGEAIELQLPKPDSLLPLGSKLPPIRLEANYTEPISLKGALTYALENCLAIRIQLANKSQQKWLDIGQAGGFLPNMIMNFQHQFIGGSTLVSGIIPASFHTPNTTAQAGFQLFGFQGGSVLFGFLSQLHTYKAAKAAVTGSINDTLLAVSRGYYNLVQNQALLQIMTRAVDVSRAQVTLNQQLERAGTGTKFQVLQSETQLARDEQNLLTQEVSLRNSSIDLATVLNLNQGVNFLSVEPTVRKVRLIDPGMDINRLIALAILYRPELKQYEELRVAARRLIQKQAAPLYPQFQFFGNVLGNGATLGPGWSLVPGSYSAVPLYAPAQPGTPITIGPPFVSGGASGAASGGGSSTLVGVAEQYTPPHIADRGMKRSYSIGVQVAWNFPGLGVPAMASIQAARASARIALLNSNQQLLNVIQQVRESYLTGQTAERQIEVTDRAVISATEELRLARVRLSNGVGTNIDVINAQRDFITALVNKAQAIVQFNIAQAQLLHDIGLISVETLTSGRLIRQ
ncbi:MAG TPA: TolC family protein [Chroococcales cyanobacterium]